jgi:hypothetical protein
MARRQSLARKEPPPIQPGCGSCSLGGATPLFGGTQTFAYCASVSPNPKAQASSSSIRSNTDAGHDVGQVRFIAQFIDDRKRGENTGHRQHARRSRRPPFHSNADGTDYRTGGKSWWRHDLRLDPAGPAVEVFGSKTKENMTLGFKTQEPRRPHPLGLGLLLELSLRLVRLWTRRLYVHNSLQQRQSFTLRESANCVVHYG